MGDFVLGKFCLREESGHCIFAMYGQGCATIHGSCPASQEEADALWSQNVRTSDKPTFSPMSVVLDQAIDAAPHHYRHCQRVVHGPGVDLLAAAMGGADKP